MSYGKGCPGQGCPTVSPIVCDPIVIVRDHYVPQLVPVIHPIKVVDKVHCCPVEQHFYTYEETGPVGVGGPVGPVSVSGTKAAKKRAGSRARRKR
ncbi:MULTISPECIES: hypothetical protein [Paenibacillus]|uniref:Spore coat protein D n=1 Tax=Paenibacillus campinasensis TaxID=66347 RepID=A0A268F4P5_9BACL|nr:MULTISPECIES: hypothetical protein [Paenibacillus]MUG64618.1 hypothetical protein [Paenibacillus campinasensis]PAD80341.1 hypothetical protein CHH67_01135 [Paenibacillus campinasensis]PAK55324.1 hypothetical protein CHH75_03455 [Paenibacillus sp. 7541]